MPKVLIVGSSGFLGSEISEHLRSAGFAVDSPIRSKLDLSKPVLNGQYDYAVICAAVTDVESCYRDQDTSHRVNVDGTIALLDLLRKNGTKPVFFSSDYVFGSWGKDYGETSARMPETVYGRQKLLVEKYLEENFSEFLIFRTSKLMSKTAHPRNILFPVIHSLSSSLLTRCFEDQWINPVFIEDVARVVKAAILAGIRGTYHLGTRRIFSRSELAEFIAVKMGFDPRLVKRIKIAELGLSEKRPNWNTLCCGKIEKALDFRFCEIEDATLELLRQPN